MSPLVYSTFRKGKRRKEKGRGRRRGGQEDRRHRWTLIFTTVFSPTLKEKKRKERKEREKRIEGEKRTLTSSLLSPLPPQLHASGKRKKKKKKGEKGERGRPPWRTGDDPCLLVPLPTSSRKRARYSGSEKRRREKGGGGKKRKAVHREGTESRLEGSFRIVNGTKRRISRAAKKKGEGRKKGARPRFCRPRRRLKRAVRDTSTASRLLSF